MLKFSKKYQVYSSSSKTFTAIDNKQKKIRVIKLKEDFTKP